MSYALNEMEAMAKKATRGGGYSWGMAEESGKATRWLCAFGIDGSKALVEVLSKTDGAELGEMAPSKFSEIWQADSGVMCPLMAGAALCDSASLWSEAEVRIKAVIAPVMILPFAAMAARQLGAAVTVEWDGVRAVTDGSDVSMVVNNDASTLEIADVVTTRLHGHIDQPLPHHSRANPAEADWNTLMQFAHRTYAPDTEESRLKGAGAGLSDND